METHTCVSGVDSTELIRTNKVVLLLAETAAQHLVWSLHSTIENLCSLFPGHMCCTAGHATCCYLLAICYPLEQSCS